MTEADLEIQRAVESELKWDLRIIDSQLHVAVELGIVTLSGTVNSYGERVAAEKAAHHVPDVLDVANDIQVKLPKHFAKSDTEIAQAVRLALEWDVLVPESRIRSTVANGEVTLEGDVDNSAQRDDAERVVHNLAGVRRINNEIKVIPSNLLPHEVAKSIERAFERRARSAAKRVVFEVSNGRVILSGTVHSGADRQAAVEAARRTCGVRSVDDRLRIDPNAA
jgi:osmotically-inducible protein OsmY